MMKLKGAKIPPKIVFPIQLQNQRVRDSCVKGYPQEASATSLIPLSLLQQDVSVGGGGTRDLSKTTMSIPGPASPVVLSASRRVEGVRSSAGASRGQRRLPTPARSTRSSGRTGPGNRHCSGSRAASSLPTRATVEIGGQLRRRGSPAEARTARSRHGVPDLLARPRPLGRREPLPRRTRRASSRRTDGWRSGRPASSRSSGSTSRSTAPTGSLSLAERQFLEVVKALLAQPKVLLLDEPTTALGPEEVERLHALVLEQSRGRRRHRLRQPPPAGGARDRRPRSPSSATASARGRSRPPAMSEESLVALMIGRPLQLAFPERHGADGRARGAARGLGPPAATASGRSTSRSRRARSSGSPAPRATGRCRSSGRSPASERSTGQRHLQRPRARHPIAARRRSGQESCCSAATGPGRRSSPSSASGRTPRSRCCGGWDASGFLNRRRERRHGRRPRAAPEHSHGVDRAARPVALGRQPAEGLADAPVPARRTST